MLFDLFFYILVANRGDLPGDFDLTAFYKDGTCEDLYR
jgi:hypothetical protein